MHNQQREPQPYEDCQAKSIQASRATTHRRVKEFGYSCHQRCLTWAKEEKNWTVGQWSKVLFQMRASFVFHLETKVLESGGRKDKLIAQVAWSPVLSFHSLMICGAMSSAGVGPLCFLKTNVTAPFTKTFWSTSCFLLLTSILKMLISFSRDAKSTKSWLNDHGVGVLDWPATHQNWIS